jgi:hypothetical protein
MRYYDIAIFNSANGQLIKRYSSTSDGQVTSPINGAALKVEFDIQVSELSTPTGNSWIRIWGVDFNDISQSVNFLDQTIEVRIGMSPGLPLATAQSKFSGLVLTGSVFQAFGNFQGTLLSLDLIVTGLVTTPFQPKNISFSWVKGTTMAQTIKQTLATAFPGYLVNVNISNKLVYTETQPGFYANLQQYAAYLYDTSKAIIRDPNYTGVRLSLSNNVFTVTDNSVNQTPSIILNLNDFVAQPTWIDFASIQFDMVARSDLVPGIVIGLPVFLATNSAQTWSRYRDNTIFTGTGRVNRVRHLGNSRQLDGDSWKTVVDVLFSPINTSP